MGFAEYPFIRKNSSEIGWHFDGLVRLQHMNARLVFRFRVRSLTLSSFTALAALALAACGTDSDSGHQVAEAQIRTAEIRWQANKPARFAYKLVYSCFCPHEDRGPYLVEAHGDSIVHVQRIRTNYPNTSDGVVTYDTSVVSNPGPSYSIDSLFNLVRLAVSEDNATEIAEFDPTWGFPKSVITEIGPQVEDDYWALSVSEFRVLLTE